MSEYVRLDVPGGSNVWIQKNSIVAVSERTDGKCGSCVFVAGSDEPFVVSDLVEVIISLVDGP